eukprot:scaffold68355_cov53-Phaeocystis_antarctica.AAC.2
MVRVGVRVRVKGAALDLVTVHPVVRVGGLNLVRVKVRAGPPSRRRRSLPRQHYCYLLAYLPSRRHRSLPRQHYYELLTSHLLGY